MSALQTDASAPVLPPAGPPRRRWRDPDVLTVAGAALVALALALATRAHHLHGVPGVLRASLVSLVLFAVCGDAIAYALVPLRWRAVRPLFSLGFGAAASGLVLMVFGLAHVPLDVSLWLTLALGLTASAVVRRRGIESPEGAADAGTPAWPRERSVWILVLVVVWLVALLPAGRTGADTVYGQNPDAHQVVGIAVLFQHVPPTHTDVALPIDQVPGEWRFRYPIFYPLAAASALGHDDPIRVFPGMAALLVVITAFGFALFAVECLGAPRRAGPLIAAVAGLTWTTTHLAWHPYWNQLWGTAMFPYALLFGWRAVRTWEPRAAVLAVFVLVVLWLAYPLALPYPVVILIGQLIAYWRRPRMPSLRRARAWIALPLGLLILLPAVAGAVLKMEQATRQLLSSHSQLWGGDLKHFLNFGLFVGTGGGIVAALVVLAVAAYGLRGLPRRSAIALGVVLAALCLLDLRFRESSSGQYMDYKHLSFTGIVVLMLAASAVTRLLWSGDRRWLAGGAVLAAAWTVAAVVQDRADAFLLPQQAPAQMFQIRQWMAKIPAGASVRVDIPPSGQQLWAVYMVGSHPVSSTDPIRGTTYAYAKGSYRADYALELRYDPRYGPESTVPEPPIWFAQNPPLFENSLYVLRKVDWPTTGDCHLPGQVVPCAAVYDESSTRLNES